jgi:hypothetical protein
MIVDAFVSFPDDRMVQTAQQALEPLFQRQVIDGCADRIILPFAVEVEPVSGGPGNIGENFTQGGYSGPSG